MNQLDNFLPVSYDTEFWQHFADITADEDWDETIDRLVSEGWSIEPYFLTNNGTDDNFGWPDGLIFNSAAEKLKFILKYSG